MLAISDYMRVVHCLLYSWCVAAAAGAWFILTRLVYQNYVSNSRTGHAVLI